MSMGKNISGLGADFPWSSPVESWTLEESCDPQSWDRQGANLFYPQHVCFVRRHLLRHCGIQEKSEISDLQLARQLFARRQWSKISDKLTLKFQCVLWPNWLTRNASALCTVLWESFNRHPVRSIAASGYEVSIICRQSKETFFLLDQLFPKQNPRRIWLWYGMHRLSECFRSKQTSSKSIEWFFYL